MENTDTVHEKSENETQDFNEKERNSRIGGVLKAIGWLLLTTIMILTIILCLNEKYVIVFSLLSAGILGSCTTIGFGEIMELLQDIKHKLKR